MASVAGRRRRRRAPTRRSATPAISVAPARAARPSWRQVIRTGRQPATLAAGPPAVGLERLAGAGGPVRRRSRRSAGARARRSRRGPPARRRRASIQALTSGCGQAGGADERSGTAPRARSRSGVRADVVVGEHGARAGAWPASGCGRAGRRARRRSNTSRTSAWSSARSSAGGRSRRRGRAASGPRSCTGCRRRR